MIQDNNNINKKKSAINEYLEEYAKEKDIDFSCFSFLYTDVYREFLSCLDTPEDMLASIESHFADGGVFFYGISRDKFWQDNKGHILFLADEYDFKPSCWENFEGEILDFAVFSCFNDFQSVIENFIEEQNEGEIENEYERLLDLFGDLNEKFNYPECGERSVNWYCFELLEKIFENSYSIKDLKDNLPNISSKSLFNKWLKDYSEKEAEDFYKNHKEECEEILSSAGLKTKNLNKQNKGRSSLMFRLNEIISFIDSYSI